MKLLPILALLVSSLAVANSEPVRDGAGEYRGVSLDDLMMYGNPDMPEQRELIAVVSKYIKGEPDLKLGKTLSRTLFKVDYGAASSVFVDIFGRDKRFAAVNPEDKKTGGLGLLRVQVYFERDDETGELSVGKHYVALQRSYVEMQPEIVVSLYDQLAVMTDEDTGFRRSFPLGVGALDRVRYPGHTKLMTPSLEWGRLNKNHLERSKPKNYRNKPFINFGVAISAPEGNKPIRYRTSGYLAFHIWQSPKFERGFLSHGCLRMRDQDLDEVLAIVDGVKDSVPLHIRLPEVFGARHPFPHLTAEYETIHNFGTKTEPESRKEKDKYGHMLTRTDRVKADAKNPWPAQDEIELLPLDPPKLGPAPETETEEDDD